MPTICPTVTAEDAHTYRAQLERLLPFSERIHLDFMDGLFTKNKSVAIEAAWMPEGKQIDMHLMFMRPDLYLDHVIAYKPSLVILQAEARCEYAPLADRLRQAGIGIGIALLQETPASLLVKDLDTIDHVLIFSGNLGHFGGEADLKLLDKVSKLKNLKPELEVGWDGGITDKNVRQLIDGGVDVLNVGGFIQRADNPQEQFRKLAKLM